jgi:uncharacterized protein
MKNYQPSRMLKLLFTETDRYDGRPLYEAILDKCRELNIAGATVFRGIEGYGDTAEIHHSHIVKHDLPISVTIIDSKEHLQCLVPALEAMMGKGMIVASDVTMIRVRKTVESHGA